MRQLLLVIMDNNIRLKVKDGSAGRLLMPKKNDWNRIRIMCKQLNGMDWTVNVVENKVKPVFIYIFN